MILNFEADLGEVLYDVDAEVSSYAESGDPVVKLLEVRLVGEDGSSFVVVQPERLVPKVVAELKVRAVADYQERTEMTLEHWAEHGGES